MRVKRVNVDIDVNLDVDFDSWSPINADFFSEHELHSKFAE